MPAHRGYDYEPRAQAITLIKCAPAQAETAESRLAWLRAGHQWFLSATVPAGLPTSYRVGDGYKMPEFDDIQSGRTRVFLGNLASNGQIASYEEARQFWVSRGSGEPSYLDEAEQEARRWQKIEREGNAVLQEPFSLRLRKVSELLPWELGYYGVLVLLGDALGAGLRALVAKMRRRRRTGIRLN